MKYLDEFRDAGGAMSLIRQIRRVATRGWTIMEVCGGQTHGLMRYGIAEELADIVELIHGPGCPVCVTSLEAIDLAIEWSLRPGMLVTTFGDMLRVPGSRESLMDARARGGAVQTVYSPLEAVEIARRDPRRQVVFFAVGFETTAPATALAVRQAASLGLGNFSALVRHVRVQPAMEALMQMPEIRIDGFLAAGHVCTVMGFEAYNHFTAAYAVPVVITGFEPIDLLAGILRCVTLLERREPAVSNCYARSARPRGNQEARRLVDEVYEICDRSWRGFGLLREGGLRLRGAWRRFDAEERFGGCLLPVIDTTLCQSGLVLSGRIKPNECSCFGRECTPDMPLGAPMVSSEGACAAYYRYARKLPSDGTTISLDSA
jgi:hydrogenase expression/formation protein HypD